MRNFEVIEEGYQFRLKDFRLVEKQGLVETDFRHRIEFAGQDCRSGMNIDDMLEVLRLAYTHRYRRKRSEEGEEILEHLYQVTKLRQQEIERKQIEKYRKSVNPKLTTDDYPDCAREYPTE